MRLGAQLVELILKGAKLFFGALPGNAVALLDLPQKIVSITLQLSEIIIREFSPLRLDPSAQLLPLPFDLIFVH